MHGRWRCTQSLHDRFRCYIDIYYWYTSPSEICLKDIAQTDNSGYGEGWQLSWQVTRQTTYLDTSRAVWLPRFLPHIAGVDGFHIWSCTDGHPCHSIVFSWRLYSPLYMAEQRGWVCGHTASETKHMYNERHRYILIKSYKLYIPTWHSVLQRESTTLYLTISLY